MQNSYKGPIVAEGDSWFSYAPAGNDVIQALSKKGYDIINFSIPGDTLSNMVKGPESSVVINKIRELQPSIVLFSGGGNDVSGDSFKEYLNDRTIYTDPINELRLRNNINRFRTYIREFIMNVENVSFGTKIIMHGYAYSRPDGRPVASGLLTKLYNGGSWTGPWLKPALDEKNINDISERNSSVIRLTDAYNSMLKNLSNVHDNFFYIDLRKKINPDTDWINEFHLNDDKFSFVGELFHQKIQRLVGGNPYIGL